MIGTLFADRYRILRQLGEEGGSGVVWEAIDTHQEMTVALKAFHPGSPTIHAYGEAQLLTALEGEHVLRVYNADTYLDIPYITTRVASQGSAEDYLRRHPMGIRPDWVVSWTRQALVGLGACHERGLLHRDIKPANIFLERDDRALLGDFGLVHQLDADGRAPWEGSPYIIAPEMWATQSGTLASDIYSMGVSLYRMLTGEWPIFALSRAALKPLVLAGTSRPLRDIAPHVTRRLASRVHKALAVDPAERYQDWREMHEDLGHVGVVARTWERMDPEIGHLRCWNEVGVRRGAMHRVCLTEPQLGRQSIVSRRTTGSQSRLSAHCRDHLTDRHVPANLRNIFDRL